MPINLFLTAPRGRNSVPQPPRSRDWMDTSSVSHSDVHSEFRLTILFCYKVSTSPSCTTWTRPPTLDYSCWPPSWKYVSPPYKQGPPLIPYADPNVPPQTIHPLPLHISQRRRLPLHILPHPTRLSRIHDHILRPAPAASTSVLPLRLGNRTRTTPHAHARARVAERPGVPAAPVVVRRGFQGVPEATEDGAEDCCEGGAGFGAAPGRGDMSVTTIVWCGWKYR
jgi:hypothetical protein